MIPEISSEKQKKLKHVKVYDQLFKKIQDGVYPPGSKLPSEPNLAEQMGVSRMTLRRALALLQEDGLISNIQGKGNYIKELHTISKNFGMEKLQHPFYACCDEDIDDLEIEFRIEPATDAISKNLERKTAAVVISDRWYKFDGVTKGYSLSFIPIEAISEYDVDLNDIDSLKDFMENRVYSIVSKSNCEFSFTTTGNFTAIKYELSHDEMFILILETLYNSNGNVIISTKHYIPLTMFRMHLNVINKLNE